MMTDKLLVITENDYCELMGKMDKYAKLSYMSGVFTKDKAKRKKYDLKANSVRVDIEMMFMNNWIGGA